ncbi:PhzF family phenazine biosynthesis protein [Aurantivibrio infirmus]
MDIKVFHLDAFSSAQFAGNPAAVCPLLTWLPDKTMQSIAAEINLSETAFFVREEDRFHIRWFTPETEVKLCGHATLASAYVIFKELDYDFDTIEFSSLSGSLYVNNSHQGLTLNFPVQAISEVDLTQKINDALGTTPTKVLAGEDLVAVYEKQSDIEGFLPDFFKLKNLPYRGIVITAPGEDSDFVCRFFAPAKGVLEDPVTGSAYTKITPYWAERLGKHTLVAKQLSRRGGTVHVELTANRVLISGRVTLFSKGTIFLV